jgi:tetratricopeptide (TPR) repeat protein
LAKRYTENTEAYRLYLKGRYFWNKRTVDGFEKAIEYFQQAINLDPNYALAYSGLADCYALFSAGLLPPKEAMAKAKAAATKAVEIDDTLSEAHASLASVKHLYDLDWSGAEREFKRAIELNPNYAIAHLWYSHILSAVGRHNEAVAEAKRALELEPVSVLMGKNVGHILYEARQYDQALEYYKKALEMDPSFAQAQREIGLVYEQKGMYQEAMTALQKLLSLSGRYATATHKADLGHVYAVSGKSGEALKVLNELQEESKHHYVSPYDIAVIYTGLGEKEQALEWLEKVYEDRSYFLMWLSNDPRLDSLRSEPRFADLLRRVGLPQ